MKRILHTFLGILIWILFIGLGSALIYANILKVQVGPLGHVYFPEGPIQASVVGSLMVLLALLHSITLAPRHAKMRAISFDSEGGMVSISVNAVCDFIRKLGDEFESVKNIDPKIHSKKEMLHIDLHLKVRIGTRIPELSAQLQHRVRESIRENLGIVDVREIKVNISEIVGTPPPPVLPETVDNLE